MIILFVFAHKLYDIKNVAYLLKHTPYTKLSSDHKKWKASH